MDNYRQLTIEQAASRLKVNPMDLYYYCFDDFNSRYEQRDFVRTFFFVIGNEIVFKYSKIEGYNKIDVSKIKGGTK